MKRNLYMKHEIWLRETNESGGSKGGGGGGEGGALAPR